VRHKLLSEQHPHHSKEDSNTHKETHTQGRKRAKQTSRQRRYRNAESPPTPTSEYMQIGLNYYRRHVWCEERIALPTSVEEQNTSHQTETNTRAKTNTRTVPSKNNTNIESNLYYNHHHITNSEREVNLSHTFRFDSSQIRGRESKNLFVNHQNIDLFIQNIKYMR
jgi:hypothetical protein